mgnify:CR=1 FL=1
MYKEYKIFFGVVFLLLFIVVFLYSVNFSNDSNEITGAAIVSSEFTFKPIPRLFWVFMASISAAVLTGGFFLKKYEKGKEGYTDEDAGFDFGL